MNNMIPKEDVFIFALVVIHCIKHTPMKYNLSEYRWRKHKHLLHEKEFVFYASHISIEIFGTKNNDM